MDTQLLSILNDNPTFYPKANFKKVLEQVYRELTKKSSRLPIPKNATSQQKQLMDEVERIEILLDEALNFLNTTFRDYNGKTIFTFDQLDELIEFLNTIPKSQSSKLSNDLRGVQLCFQLAERLSECAALMPHLLSVGKEYHCIRWVPMNLNMN